MPNIEEVVRFPGHSELAKAFFDHGWPNLDKETRRRIMAALGNVIDDTSMDFEIASMLGADADRVKPDPDADSEWVDDDDDEPYDDELLDIDDDEDDEIEDPNESVDSDDSRHPDRAARKLAGKYHIKRGKKKQIIWNPDAHSILLCAINHVAPMNDDQWSQVQGMLRPLGFTCSVTAYKQHLMKLRKKAPKTFPVRGHNAGQRWTLGLGTRGRAGAAVTSDRGRRGNIRTRSASARSASGGRGGDRPTPPPAKRQRRRGGAGAMLGYGGRAATPDFEHDQTWDRDVPKSPSIKIKKKEEEEEEEDRKARLAVDLINVDEDDDDDVVEIPPPQTVPVRQPNPFARSGRPAMPAHDVHAERRRHASRLARAHASNFAVPEPWYYGEQSPPVGPDHRAHQPSPPPVPVRHNPRTHLPPAPPAAYHPQGHHQGGYDTPFGGFGGAGPQPQRYQHQQNWQIPPNYGYPSGHARQHDNFHGFDLGNLVENLAGNIAGLDNNNGPAGHQEFQRHPGPHESPRVRAPMAPMAPMESSGNLLQEDQSSHQGEYGDEDNEA